MISTYDSQVLCAVEDGGADLACLFDGSWGLLCIHVDNDEEVYLRQFDVYAEKKESSR